VGSAWQYELRRHCDAAGGARARGHPRAPGVCGALPLAGGDRGRAGARVGQQRPRLPRPRQEASGLSVRRGLPGVSALVVWSPGADGGALARGGAPRLRRSDAVVAFGGNLGGGRRARVGRPGGRSHRLLRSPPPRHRRRGGRRGIGLLRRRLETHGGGVRAVLRRRLVDGGRVRREQPRVDASAMVQGVARARARRGGAGALRRCH
jgi:hypothetical protein